MNPTAVYEFGPFRVDTEEKLIWNGSERVALRGKAFDVLAVLIHKSGRAVSKAELMDSVWGGVAVEEANLTVAISQLRKALREQVRDSDYIETLPGRGYRFAGRSRPLQTAARTMPNEGRSQAYAEPESAAHSALFVGREDELGWLLQRCDDVRHGARRVVFLVGDAGIGKTALITRFCAHVGEGGSELVASGSCVDAYGSREPYLPVVTTLARLGRGPRAAQVLTTLERVAPAWAALLPSLFTPDKIEAFTRRANSVGQPQMLLQFAQLMEALADEQPLIWCLEDIHWADRSTLELVAYLARGDLRRMMLVATSRPAYAETSPLINDLTAGRSPPGVCEKVLVRPFTREQVERYLNARFQPHSLPVELSDLIFQRTNGTPLFVVQWADALVDKGLIKATGERWQLCASIADAGHSVPSTTAQTIEIQVDKLSRRERTVLEVACVAGTRFGIVAVADVLGEDCVEVERICLDWASQERFLRVLGEAEWPDGTRTTLFSFAHSLYQEVLYSRLGAAHRARLHQRLAQRMESAYGQYVVDIAAELATHFERGADHLCAAKYFLLAGSTALTRHAYASSSELLERGIRELSFIPDGPEKLCLEFELYSALGAARSAEFGHMAPEAHAAYGRVRELSLQLQHTPLDVAFGAWMTHFMRGDYAGANDFAVHWSSHASNTADEILRAAARAMMGLCSLYMGRVVEAREQLDSALSFLDLEQRELPISGQLDPGFIAYNVVWAHWLAGFPDKARALAERSVAIPQVHDHPVGYAYLLNFASVVHEECGDYARAMALAESTPRSTGFLSDLVKWQIGVYRLYLGDDGANSHDLGLQLSHFMGTGIGVAVTRPPAALTYFFIREGNYSQASETLRQAFDLLISKRERWWEAELHRLHGELWLALAATGKSAAGCDRGSSGADGPEACFQRALEVAQAQRALSFELRAAMSLSKLWYGQGRRESARKLLEDTYGSFTEGFDTRDLLAARELLESFQDGSCPTRA